MSTGTETTTTPPWPGWPGLAWQASRWVLAGCVLAAALLVVSGLGGAGAPGSPGWGRTVAFWGAACLRITAVLAVFMPMVVAVRHGRWGFSPFGRSIAQLTLAGWVAAWAVYLATLALLAMA
ncbi:MAG: hypothetical protein IT433_02040 [Phycisphaerales bacterium]|nr:hypothetical protein [Phycisphaerales bacterium]